MTASLSGQSAAWGDYDGDGDLDLFVTNAEVNQLFRNDGLAGFNEVSTGSPPAEAIGFCQSGVWGDDDNDGDLDLYVANFTGTNRLYRNNGNGTFTSIGNAALQDPNSTVGAAWADMDRDGDLDLYIANWAGPNRLLRNDTANGNRSLRVRLVTGTRSQIREVEGASGYVSQSSLRVEFGTGTAAVTDILQITWPSGIVQTLNHVRSNQDTTIVESGATDAGDATEQTLVFRHRAAPNPFTSELTIDYELPATTAVRITIFDVRGRAVRTLESRGRERGHHAAWDGRDASGRPALYRLEAGAHRGSGRIVHLR